MVRFSRSAFFALANLMLLSPAHASGLAGGAPEATLSWRLDFDGREIHTGYAAALGLRSAGRDRLTGELFSLNVSDRNALARLAGVPLVSRSYRTDQNDLDEADGAPARKPWYSRQWVWWTVGGIATAAAVSGASIGSSEEGGTLIVSGGPNGCSGGGNVGPLEVPETCTPPTEGGTVIGTDDDGNVCVIEGFGNPQDVCAPTGFAPRHSAGFLGRIDTGGLDAGTGGMGDLLAR